MSFQKFLQPKSWSTALCCYTYLMTCLPRFKPLLFVSVLHTIPVSMNSKGPGRQSRSHTSNIVPARLVERVWGTKCHSSLQNIYFPLRWFQSSLLLIYFCDGPNRCSHYTKVWKKTYPICDTLLSRSARRSFAMSQKLRNHKCSCVWTEALYGMIFVAAQKLCGIVWIFNNYSWSPNKLLTQSPWGREEL